MGKIEWSALITLAIAIIGFAVFIGTLRTQVDDLDKKIDSGTANLDRRIDSIIPNIAQENTAALANIRQEKKAALGDINSEAGRVENELSNALVVKSTDTVNLDLRCGGGSFCCPIEGKDNTVKSETVGSDDGKIIAAWWSPRDAVDAMANFQSIDVSVKAGHIEISCRGLNEGKAMGIRLFWIAK